MNMQKYAKKIYAEICIKYANICICPMSLPQLHIYAKICKKYAKYVSMKFIYIICTPHFADVSRVTSGSATHHLLTRTGHGAVKTQKP